MMFFFSDPVEDVRRVLRIWSPKGCQTEKDYEESLANELKTEMKNTEIIQQYGSGRQRVDIVVDQKVAIEIKNDMTSTAAIHRAIGQLEGMKKWDKVFLVLCGETSDDGMR